MKCPICFKQLEGTKDDSQLYCKTDDCFVTKEAAKP
jgi:hypothetical protein